MAAKCGLVMFPGWAMLSVLIVTDNGSSFCELAEPFLAQGYVVHEAFPASALNCIRMYDADVVVINVVDKGRGLELAEQIRDLPTGDMCVIIGVANPGAEPCPAAFDCIVPGPISPNGLATCLRRLDREWTVESALSLH
jgi:CheY-like chemotaxis protein